MTLDHRKNAENAMLTAATLLGLANNLAKNHAADDRARTRQVEQLLDDLQRVEREIQRARQQLRLSEQKELFL